MLGLAVSFMLGLIVGVFAVSLFTLIETMNKERKR